MAKYRMVQVDFWTHPRVLEDMPLEEKCFYLYLLTNPNTTQIGIYRITKKKVALELDISVEKVQSLMKRFIEHYQLIRYNEETSELAIKNWGKYNLNKGGKPVLDCIYSELQQVRDTSLIHYVSLAIKKEEIISLYESFFQQDDKSAGKKSTEQNDEYTYLETNCEDFDEALTYRDTNRGQKEKEKEKQQQKQKENEKEKQQQIDFYPKSELNLENEKLEMQNSKGENAKQIYGFWDHNGFGISNFNAKEQLLAWLNDSKFIQPTQVILKAMNIACANNKRMLNYVVGILKNWENQSLLTIEEIDLYHDKQKQVHKRGQPSSKPDCFGKAIPRNTEVDITAGEDW
jgi:DnaD/phage-associated family protein